MTSHQAQSMIARRGPQGSRSPKFSVISTIISEVMAYCTNWCAPFFFVGRHLESVSRTEPIFELNLAPSEESADLRISVRFGQLLSSYRVQVTSCNVCARAKLKGHRELKIEQSPSLVQ